MGTRAQLVDILLAGIRDSSGQPVSGANIHSYDAGTTTPRSLYSDYKKLSAASNPYVADSNGRAQLYGDGLYKLVIKDAADSATLYTWDNLPYFLDPGPMVYAGTAGGTANAQTITLSPAPGALASGLTISWKSVGTNSGAVTINPNGIGAYALKDSAGNALLAGALISGVFYEATFDGTNFILTGDIYSAWRTWTPSCTGSGTLTYTGLTITGRYCLITPKLMHVIVSSGGTIAGAGTDINFSAPPTYSLANAMDNTLACSVQANGDVYRPGSCKATTQFVVRRHDSSNWPVGASNFVFFSGAVEIA